MIEGLRDLLRGSGQPGLGELRQTVGKIMGANASGKVVRQQQLKPRVYRLQVDAGGQIHSLVAKRLDLGLAHRNQLVAQRWLPAIGLEGACAKLLAIAAERNGLSVWHLYEDLGEWELDAENPDPQRVAAAVELIGQLHRRAANHWLVPEWRKFGDDFDSHYFSSNVRDAISALEALRFTALRVAPQHAGLVDRLLSRIHRLRNELPVRTQAMADLGGPDTLLHGDLWTTNTLVVPTADGLRARLIDWDHAGVGPLSYDLSTFLCRFRAADRLWILQRYRQSVEGEAWRLPSPRDLNLLFDTAECARYVNCVAWYAMALRHERADWGFAMLAEVERWFESLSPVLPARAETPDHEIWRQRAA